jgi:hypothetical protein
VSLNLLLLQFLFGNAKALASVNSIAVFDVIAFLQPFCINAVLVRNAAERIAPLDGVFTFALALAIANILPLMLGRDANALPGTDVIPIFDVVALLDSPGADTILACNFA